jgi:hypothetical protein
MTATEQLLWKLGHGVDQSPHAVVVISVTPLEHRQLYDASPGVQLPYTSVNWTQTTLRFRGIPVTVRAEEVEWAAPRSFKVKH